MISAKMKPSTTLFETKVVEPVKSTIHNKIVLFIFALDTRYIDWYGYKILLNSLLEHK